MQRVIDWLIGATVVFIATVATVRICCFLLHYPYTWGLSVSAWLVICLLRAALR